MPETYQYRKKLSERLRLCIPSGRILPAFVLGLLSLTQPLMALEFHRDQHQLEIDDGYTYLVEAGRPLSVEQVRGASAAGKWQDLEGKPNFGYRRDAIWYRLELEPRGEGEIRRYFEVTYPLLDHVELYHFADDNLVFSAITGDRQRHAERPVDVRTFVFPLVLSERLIIPFT